MSETPQTPESTPPRDTVTGRYVRRHGAPDNAPADAPSAPAPPATEGGGATPPPPPPSAPPAEEKDGRKRWMLLLLLLLILLALLCAGFAYVTWWRKDKPEAQPTQNPGATVTATATATGTAGPSPTLTGSPQVSPTTGPSVAPSPSPAKKTVAMPNVVGMPAADAKATLEGAGFTSVKFVTEANPNTDLSVLVSYTVTKQSVAAGTQVPVDTAIVITCKTTSNGKG
jgi:PASTA domain